MRSTAVPDILVGMAKHPNVGDPAPDFELEGTDGRFQLSDHRGERVVLLFYPGDNTPVCTRQFCSYRDNAEEFSALDATVVGISSQSVDLHESFTAEHGLNVPLLADEDSAVAKAYGAHAPVVGTKRAAIIVDEDGVVRYRHDHMLGLDFQSVDDLREALESVPSRA
jgi:thioredoxin-dependent peroxiredoxin